MRGESRLRGRERNNDSKTVFLTRWNRSCPCTAWERGRLARMPGTRASRPAWERGHPARLGARASCPAWDRGRLVRIGSAGISPLTPREGGTSSPYRGRFLGGACVPYLVLGFRTPKLPLLPSWEKGVGGMRGKSARECSKLRIASKNAPLEQRRTGTLFRPLKKPCSRC